MNDIARKVDVARIEESIQTLNQYVTDENIEAVMLVLEALKKTPEDESLVEQLAESLDTIGITKGAVLTYAPYARILVSQNLFEDD